MFFQRLKTPGLGQNSYVLACGDGLGVVIDPRRDIDDYLPLAREKDLSIIYVLETHRRQEDFEFSSSMLYEKHIPGSVHSYVGHLEDNLPLLLPKDNEIVVHCNVGHLSGVAASILKRNGFTCIHNMLGGISAWEKLGLPLEKPGEAKKAD